MFLMKWKGTSMIVLEFPKIYILNQECFQEEVQLKCRFLQESMNKPVNTKASNSSLSEQVTNY